jgi:hypothetical protein
MTFGKQPDVTAEIIQSLLNIARSQEQKPADKNSNLNSILSPKCVNLQGLLS